MTARILYFDIETAPNLAAVWGHWDQSVISYDEGHEWYILCFAWQWEGESKIQTISQLDTGVDFEKDPCDDRLVVERLWELFDEADIVIAHNGNKFDIRKAQARFAILDMGAPSPFRSIDTTLVARRHFAFNSNSLNNLGQTLGLGRKVRHQGYEMWQGCMRGEESWWKKMITYNRMDVKLLRAVYMRLRPFISNHPNLAVYDPDAACPSCGGGVKTARVRGYYQTQTGERRQYECLNCGSYFVARKMEPGHISPDTTSLTRR